MEAYQRYLNIYETNDSFKNDCLGATNIVLLNKNNNLSDEAVYISVNYVLAELPIWFNIPYLLNITESVLVYKELSFFWKRICYNYNLMSSQQKILIKNVDEN